MFDEGRRVLSEDDLEVVGLRRERKDWTILEPEMTCWIATEVYSCKEVVDTSNGSFESVRRVATCNSLPVCKVVAVDSVLDFDG